jgi:hypothetical protein
MMSDSNQCPSYPSLIWYKEFYCEQDYFNKSSILLERIPSAISALTLLSFGVYIMMNKKTQMHPYPLISWICITDSYLFYYFWVYLAQSIVLCYDYPFAVLSYVKQYERCWFNQILAISMTILNKILVTPLIVFNLTLNTLLFHDLYFTLKNPFKPRDTRTKWYWMIAFTCAFI